MEQWSNVSSELRHNGN